MTEIEEWKPVPIPEFDEYYEVSNLGRIRSKDRKIDCSNGQKQRHRPKQIKLLDSSGGYLRVVLSFKGNKRRTINVHRLVASAFLDNPYNLPEVNHKNGNKKDNNVSNLEWVTRKENMTHAVETGLTKRKDNKKRPLAYDEVLEIRKRYRNGETLTEISETTGTSHLTITQIVHGYTYKNIKLPIKLFETSISNDAIELVVDVLKRGFLNQGPITKKFESSLAEKFNFPNIITTNSCTSALQIALTISNIGNGDEVIVSPQTFIASGLVILMVGAKPVFCDVDENGNLCPKSFENKITSNTKAVIPVHWGGIPCKIAEIQKIATEHNIIVIEDAAHALGATVNGLPLGTSSDFAAWSFQAIKFLCTGDGGALSFKNSNLFEKIRKFQWFGMDKYNTKRTPLGDRDCDISELGHKMHMNDLSSAVGLGNLSDFDERLYLRRANAYRYIKELSGLSGLDTPTYRKEDQPSFWLFTLRVDKRDDFIKYMMSHNIECSVVDRRIDRHSVFGGKIDKLPGQELFEERQVSIPVHEKLIDEDVDYIINTIKKGW